MRRGRERRNEVVMLVWALGGAISVAAGKAVRSAAVLIWSSELGGEISGSGEDSSGSGLGFLR